MAVVNAKTARIVVATAVSCVAKMSDMGEGYARFPIMIQVYRPPPQCPPEPLADRLWRSIAAHRLHGVPPQPLHYARCRCRLPRNAEPPPAQGSEEGGQASARRARRASARQGAAFADAPVPAVPRHFSLRPSPWSSLARRFHAPEPRGFRHPRADRAADLTRGGGLYAVRRSGGLWPARL